MSAFWLFRTGWYGVGLLAASILLVLFVRRLRRKQENVQAELPSFEIPSEEEQIEALMDDSNHDLVCSVLGKKRLDPGDYYAVMTVSFQSVLRYVESNYSVDQIATTTEKLHDGYYALPIGSTWHVYYQEKGGRDHDLIAQSTTDVFRHYIEYYLHVKP